MSNARFVLGTTGGQMEISESTGVTGVTGYGTLYASSVDSKLHYVDGSGNDSLVILQINGVTSVANLIASGQGASEGHNVGSTGGTVTIDWNNSNIQKVTLSSDITSLTLSNPIQGGVYSLIVEQGGTGNTITWPSGAIKWPGGTPPTLTSGATGDTDVISLIYDPAGGTGYLGNANLAFS